VRCGADRPTKVTATTADGEGTKGAIEFTTTVKDNQGHVCTEFTIPRLAVSAIVLIE
jgi:hypothetical protein